MPNPFSVGDVVYITSGYAPRGVTKIKKDRVYTKYKNRSAEFYNDCTYPAHYSRFNFVDEPIRLATTTNFVEEPQMSNTNTLYQVNETKEFGTLLTKASDNRLVLEMKPSGEIRTYIESDVIEVQPYTIAITPLGSTVQTHIAVEKGKFEVDDLVYISSTKSLAMVVDLDTKSHHLSELEVRKTSL